MPNENVNKVILGTETLLDLTEDTVQAVDVAAGKSFHLASGARTTGTASYAGAPTNNGNANTANAILYGTVDSTSTSTAYTATVAGLDQLVDGTCVMLHNGVVTSAAGFTVNVNSLGAKKCYSNLTNATQESTIFNVAYTLMFVYAEDLDEGNGGWWIYRGYDSNTNTIGYQLRTNSGNKVASDTGYRYRLWFTSADGSKWVPANTSTSTNATSNRSMNTRAIDPFGPIVYRSTNGTCNADAGLGATGIWQQYTLSIGYSYMASGFSLSFPDSVYLRCTPQADGSAVMQDIVQALPTTKDGKIYIHLGTAYSATNMELQTEHPVYWHDGTGIRIWTGAEPSGGGGTKTTWYGTCSTSSTAEKVVTCDGFALEAGAMISVLFSQANTYGQPTLNVNGTGAKSVYVGNSDTYGDANPLKWTAKTLITFVYDGTQYRYIAASAAASVTPPRGACTWYGTCSTTATTATKTSQINNFVPTRGALVLLHATTANTYTAGALKLNINSTGDKAIYKGSAATSSTNTLTWAADDDLMFMYDGSEYRYCFGSSTESGGASVEPATANPAMDGTAAVGSSDKYAREDHVHPTDTSRAAWSHDHGSITNAGAITSDTAAASGDKLVIADSSDSSKLKRSGIAFGSSTSTFLRNDGTWATPSGGGGGGGSWTDVSSLFTVVGEGGEEVRAITDGTLVYLSAYGGAIDYVQIPSEYTPICMSFGTALSDDQSTVLACYVDDGGTARAVDASLMFGLTVVYPIAIA